MSAYLRFFELERSPFEGKAQSQVVLGTRALRDAFGMIESGLADGASRICVSGGPGLGKTSLARALPKLLGDGARVAVILDPSIAWETSRESLARQWGLRGGQLSRAALVEAATERRLVLAIDQAEQASVEFLDHLDVLLSFRTSGDEPVVQSILLARLASPSDADAPPLLWWLDRIQTLQLEFAPMPRDGVESYIHKHLKRAGWQGEQLFDEAAAHAIHEYSGGVPGSISELCERLLVAAAERRMTAIDDAFVRSICEPTTIAEDESAKCATPNKEDLSEDAVERETIRFEERAHEQAGDQAEDECDEQAESAASEEEASDGEWTFAGQFDDLSETEPAETPDIQTHEAEEEVDADAASLSDEEVDEDIDVDEAALAEALEFFEAAAAGAPGNRTEETDPSEIELVAVANVGDGSNDDSSDNDGDDDTHNEAEDDFDEAQPDDLHAEMDAAWTPADEDEWPDADYGDGEYGEDDASLLALPTAAELRAIHGGSGRRLIRPLSLAAIAAVIGGLGFAFLGGSSDPVSDAPQNAYRSKSSVQLDATKQTDSAATKTPLILVQPAGGFIEPERSLAGATAHTGDVPSTVPTRVDDASSIELAAERNPFTTASESSEDGGPEPALPRDPDLKENPEALPAAPASDGFERR